MSTEVILDIDTGLASEEIEFVRQILRDAFGEFITARSGHGPETEGLDSAIEYVTKRYPEMGVAERARKADEVRLRKAIARKLRRAADNVRVETATPPETGRKTLGCDACGRALGDGHVVGCAIGDLAERTRVTPVAERTCVVLPTVFPQSIEEEAAILAEGMRDAERDEASPLTAYAKPEPDREALLREMAGTDFEYDFERFTKK